MTSGKFLGKVGDMGRDSLEVIIMHFVSMYQGGSGSLRFHGQYTIPFSSNELGVEV